MGAQGQPAPVVKAIIFPVTDVSQAAAQAVSSDASPTEGSDHSQSLFLTISAEFREAGFEIIPEDQWRARKEGANLSGHDFLDPSKAAAADRAVGADLAVGGSFSVFSTPANRAPPCDGLARSVWSAIRDIRLTWTEAFLGPGRVGWKESSWDPGSCLPGEPRSANGVPWRARWTRGSR